MRTFFLSIIFIFIFNNLHSQEIVIEYHQGIGKYFMTDLKSFNESVIKSLPFNAKLVTDFPVYWYYKLAVLKRIGRFEYGCLYYFQSTGSKISIKDYSGEYYFNTKVNSHAPGISFIYNTFDKELINIKMHLNGGIVLSNLELKEFLEVYEDSFLNEKYDFKGQNYYLEPGISINKPYKLLDFAIYFGYNFQLGNQAFYTQKNKDYVLQNQGTGLLVKPDWAGIRIGLSVRFIFKISE